MRSVHGLATGHRRLVTTLQSMGWGLPAVWADEDCDVFTVAVLLRLHISTVCILMSGVVECLMSGVVVCCGVLWCLVLWSVDYEQVEPVPGQ